jgi:hypothetical protein
MSDDSHDVTLSLIAGDDYVNVKQVSTQHRGDNMNKQRLQSYLRNKREDSHSSVQYPDIYRNRGRGVRRLFSYDSK